MLILIYIVIEYLAFQLLITEERNPHSCPCLAHLLLFSASPSYSRAPLLAIIWLSSNSCNKRLIIKHTTSLYPSSSLLLLPTLLQVQKPDADGAGYLLNWFS